MPKHIIKSDDFKDYRILRSIASSVGIDNKSLNVVVYNDILTYEIINHGIVISASDKLSEAIEVYNAI